MMTRYVGREVTVNIEARDGDGLPSAPALTVYVRPPDRAHRSDTVNVFGTSGTWTNPTLGEYTYKFTPDFPGEWRVIVVAAGSGWDDRKVAVITVEPILPGGS